MHLTLVANRLLSVPRSPFLHATRVPAGFDRADLHITELLEPGDLVVTADIPLAAAVVARGCYALDPRGKLYTTDNVAEVLATRNLMDQLRSEGHRIDGPPAIGAGDRQAFATALQRILQEHERGSSEPSDR